VPSLGGADLRKHADDRAGIQQRLLLVTGFGIDPTEQLGGSVEIADLFHDFVGNRHD